MSFEESCASPHGGSYSIDVYHRSMVTGSRITFAFQARAEGALRTRNVDVLRDDPDVSVLLRLLDREAEQQMSK
jgi:hypothetical protein